MRDIPQTPGYTAPKVPTQEMLDSVFDMEQIREGLRALARVMHKRSKAAGWWQDYNGTPENARYIIPTKLCLIHSEISEAMEGHRKDLMDDKLSHRKMIEVELADAVIRIADLAGALGLDLAGAVIEKSNYNQTREDHKLEVRTQQSGKAF